MQTPDEIMEDAADWLMRRHAGMDLAGERALAQWLARGPEHRAAFERMAGPWRALDGVAGHEEMLALRAHALVPPVEEDAPAARRHWGRAAAACLALVAAGGAAWWQLAGRDALMVSHEVLETGHGQRQAFTLADGSQVMLDADTRVEVALAAHRRSLELVRGQAYFTVAHDKTRPFVVAAGPREVVAVGTEFDVRHGDGRITIALTQGRVRVEPVGSFSASQPLVEGGTELAVGQTLTFDQRSQRTLIAASDPAAVTGWREGRLHFDHTSLASAVEAFNHYAPKPLRLAGPGLGDLPVSGVFRADDAAGFVHALTMLYPVSAHEQADAVVLSGS